MEARRPTAGRREHEGAGLIIDAALVLCMHYVVCYSGGADSQVALDIALLNYDDVEVIFCDTGLEFPETYATIEATAKHYSIDIKFLKAGKNFAEYLESFGGLYPSIRRRWCTDRLKTRPLKKYMNSLIREGLRREAEGEASALRPRKGAAALVREIDGIRMDESKTRKLRKPVEPRAGAKWDIEHIIFFWNKSEVFEYIRKFKLPVNPLYRMGYSRVACWFCPFRPISENTLIKQTHPDLFEQAKEWESQYGRRFNYVMEDQPDNRR